MLLSETSASAPGEAGRIPWARRLAGVALGGLPIALWTALVAAGLIPLALSRHFHVDEIQVAFNAALLGLHQRPEWMNYEAPLVVMLGWIAARGGESWSLLLEMRAVFVVLFLLNVGLVALAAPRVRGFAARAAVLLAVTLLQPLWRHGFEIRHDVLLLTGSLLLFLLTQRAVVGDRGIGPLGLASAGAIAGWMQLNSFKAFLIWPAALVLLVAVALSRRPGLGLRRAFAALLFGVAVALSLGFTVMLSGGVAGAFVREFISFGRTAAEAARFGAGERIVGLLLELPHLFVLAVVALVFSVLSLVRGRASAELGSVVAGAWLLLQLAGLGLNPTPYTYNLLHLIPFLFLAAVDGFALILKWIPRATGGLVCAAILVSALAFVRSAGSDEVGWLSGAPQRAHVEAVEALTAPGEPVLDGAGLVLARPPAGRDWMLHSLSMSAYRRGERVRFHEMLAVDPAPVLLTNYRWEWLGRDDRDWIVQRYLPLAPRLLVLGGRDRAESGVLEILRAGRYRFAALAGGSPVIVDDQELPPDGVAELARGSHRWVSAGVLWRWVGPGSPLSPAALPLLPNDDLFISD